MWVVEMRYEDESYEENYNKCLLLKYIYTLGFPYTKKINILLNDP